MSKKSFGLNPISLDPKLLYSFSVWKSISQKNIAKSYVRIFEMKNFIVSVLGKFILTNSSTIDDLMNKEGAECVTVPATMVKQLRCRYGDDIANGRELFFALRAQKCSYGSSSKSRKKRF
jgi:hypothetical protein